MNYREQPLAEQIALVTGANSGLGRAVAGALAGQGATVLMVCRDPGRGEAARQSILAATGNPRVQLLVADLASQSAIRNLAAQVQGRWDRLHLLVNNAGTAFPVRRLSPDGIEMALAVNHLAPFLLTNLLLDPLRAAAPARIVNVGTRIDTAMDLTDLNWERRPYRLLQAYGQSKLGNLHFTFELARRLAGSGVTVNCCFPGVFLSNLGGTDGAQGIFWRTVALLGGWAIPTPEQAARRALYLATDPAMEGVTGGYYGNRKSIPAPVQARDPEANRRLWEISAGLTGLGPAG
jgi:NAD(P)-dependent dehydrogenase (short-subunit alcohol dehydrogenase family)